MKSSHEPDISISQPIMSLFANCTHVVEPPCTGRYARWCERSAGKPRLLLDCLGNKHNDFIPCFILTLGQAFTIFHILVIIDIKHTISKEHICLFTHCFSLSRRISIISFLNIHQNPSKYFYPELGNKILTNCLKGDILKKVNFIRV